MSKRIPDLPILGEPLIAEFANTLYIDDSTQMDVLDHPCWIAAWFRQAPCAADLTPPERLGAQDAARLRGLRDAVRGLLDRRRDSRSADIKVINTVARPGVSQRRLASSATGRLEVVTEVGSHGIEGVLAAIALRVIDAVANETFELNQLCDRPGCNLYYFKDHHRRRYCNVRCANAHRQARYNARLLEPSRRHTTAR
jgi:predicted RNA-binding Zn ribbon-like protein